MTLQHLALVAVTVLEYDEAIDFYVGTLGFTLDEDTDLGDGKRWVRVSPPWDPGRDDGDATSHARASILLARAVTTEQKASVGNQTGGRVFLFLHTDDFHRDHERLVAKGVEFIRGPVEEPYGTVGVFKDLYGNSIDLVERHIYGATKG